jgi:hypothetical protein
MRLRLILSRGRSKLGSSILRDTGGCNIDSYIGKRVLERANIYVAASPCANVCHSCPSLIT